MKSKLFRTAATKATALAVGSLVVLSGQALAFSPDNQEMTNTGVLDNSELLIAQCMSMECEPVEPKDQAALAESIAIAETAAGNALAAAQASSIPSAGRDAIARALSRATSILGDAHASSQSTALTEGDAAAIAESVAVAETIIGNAEAIAQSFAFSEEGRSLARSIAQAETVAGDAVAVAQSVAG